MEFIVLFAAVLVVIVLVRALSGRGAANKFFKLGNINGMKMAEIVKKVGMPDSISDHASGGKLYQWIGTSGGGYHYAILSDGHGNAVRYTHQFTR